MSINLTIAGVVSPPTSVRLTSTAITDIYTAPDSNDVVVGIIVVNETASAVNVMIDRYDGTTNWHTFAAIVPASGSSLLDDGFPIRLLTGHKIRATAATANALTVSVDRATVAGRNVAGGQSV